MRSSASLLLVFLLAVSSPADTWNQFRGSSGGKVAEITHPLAWSDDSSIAWAIPLKGSGWSSPLVVGERVFLTSAESGSGGRPKGMAAGVASMRSFRSADPDSHKFCLSCFALKTGEKLWDQEVGETVPAVIHPSNTYATESPVSDGQRIIAFFPSVGIIAAWDFEGNELWRKELGSYKSGNGFGSGSSLAIAEELVFVQYDNDESSFVAAFDSASGEQRWRDDRPAKTSWSTPLLWRNAERTELVTCGSDVVTSYDPRDGSVLWRLTGMQSAFSGSPAIDADRIYFGNSGPMSAGPLVAVAAGAEGDISLDGKFESDKISWSRTRSGPGMASPVVAKGCLYIPGSGGILNCYEAQSGERLYRKRVSNMKTVVASLWADEERVFILDEDGTTHVVKSGSEFELLGSNQIDDLVWSTPAVAGDTLLIRGVEKLYCIRD